MRIKDMKKRKKEEKNERKKKKRKKARKKEWKKGRIKRHFYHIEFSQAFIIKANHLIPCFADYIKIIGSSS